MSVVSMKQLLEAGVHFGHQTRRWNPKMKKFIFDERNGIYIIDLQKTMSQINSVYDTVRDMAQDGKTILFIGTKKQAKEAVTEEAQRCGMPYISHRWLGGMLTNFKTISLRVSYLKDLNKKKLEGYFEMLPKKEVINLEKKMEKLTRVLGGIMDMPKTPDAVFIVDPRKEHIAIKESRKLGIPIISIVDTNCDPDLIDFPIPANDDAIKAVKLITSTISSAIIEGRGLAKDIEEQEAAAAAAAAAAEANAEATDAAPADESTEASAESTEASPAPTPTESTPSQDAPPQADAVEENAVAVSQS